ncbi:MAG: ABC transporter ATP-binding protein [Candidatus Electrothrix sp. AU1_5]|nr:ABC transporter ATP-binding protein [Candidatus Electrothrix gigas]
MPVFKEIYYYFTVYKKYIGYRMVLVFFLSGLAAATEGLGISLLLPLIEIADIGVGGSTAQDQSSILLFIRGLLDFFGISSMVGILSFIACIFLLKGLISFLSEAYQSHLKAQLLYEIKSKVFHLYSSMNYSYYSSHNTGHFVNIINGQVNALVNSFNNYKHFLTIIVTTCVYLGIVSLLAWKFAVMALVAGVIFLLLFRRLNIFVRNLSRKQAVEQGHLNKFLVQTVQSFKYLSSTAQLSYLSSEVMSSIKTLSSHSRYQGIAQALTSSLSEPISIILVLVVIMIQVAVLDAPLPPIFVSLIIFNRAMGNILGIQGAWQALMSKIGSLEVVELEVEKLLKNQEITGEKKLERFTSSIEMRNVFFRYHKEHKEALADVSLQIPVNATVAFVGESGAGKSTLVDMLTLLLKSQQGQLLVDGIAADELDMLNWRRQIGYVSQESVIFDDTIANNICLWRGDFTSDPDLQQQIIKASEQAYAFEFIEKLPEKFNTIVGDRGVMLSGGQKQRLFLARELFKKPRLLILDEATSALDSESERYIQESIAMLKGRTTVAIIAHRLSTIKDADYIYVLKQGRVVEQGEYGALLENKETIFAKMVALQSL